MPQPENSSNLGKILRDASLSFTKFSLLIPQDSTYYSENYAPKRLGISYRPTRHIIEWLEENDYAVLLPGRKYKDQPAKARVFPPIAMVKKFLTSCRDSTPASSPIVV